MSATDLDLEPGDEWKDRFGVWHTVINVTDVSPGRVAVLNTDGHLIYEDTTWLAQLEAAA